MGKTKILKEGWGAAPNAFLRERDAHHGQQQRCGGVRQPAVAAGHGTVSHHVRDARQRLTAVDGEFLDAEHRREGRGARPVGTGHRAGGEAVDADARPGNGHPRAQSLSGVPGHRLPRIGGTR